MNDAWFNPAINQPARKTAQAGYLKRERLLFDSTTGSSVSI